MYFTETLLKSPELLVLQPEHLSVVEAQLVHLLVSSGPEHLVGCICIRQRVNAFFDVIRGWI